MRRVLLDYARKRKSTKRGGPQKKLPFDEDLFATDQQLEAAIDF